MTILKTVDITERAKKYVTAGWEAVVDHPTDSQSAYALYRDGTAERVTFLQGKKQKPRITQLSATQVRREIPRHLRLDDLIDSPDWNPAFDVK